MEEMDIELNLADFSNAIGNLGQGLSVGEKAVLYGYGGRDGK